jgi:hypothetical protein
MAGSALWVVQDAAYDVLAADAILQALLGGSVEAPKIYDQVPDNRSYPYAVIGDATETRDDTFGRSGKVVSITIDLWSRYAGSKEMKVIADRIAVLLDGVTLGVTGYQHVRTVHDRTVAGRDSDGVSRRAAVFFSVYVKQV